MTRKIIVTEQRDYPIWRLLTLAALTFAMNYSQASLQVYILPTIISDLSGPKRAAFDFGLIMGISTFSSSVLSLLTGYLSDLPRFLCFPKIGRRIPFIFSGTTLSCITTTIIGIISSIYFANFEDYYYNDQVEPSARILLVIIGVIVVIGQTGVGIATATYLALIPDVVKRERLGVASGFYAFSNFLGAIFSLLITAYLLVKFDSLFYISFLSSLVTFSGLMVTILSNREQVFVKTISDDDADDKNGINDFENESLISSHSKSDNSDIDSVNECNIKNDKNEKIFQSKFNKMILATKIAIKEWRRTGYIWVLFTRVVFSFGLTTIQNFALYEVQSMAQPYDLLFWSIDDPVTATSMLVTTVLIFSVISSIPGGYIGDRIGIRLVVILSSLIASAAAITTSFLIFLQTPFYLVLFVNIFCGVGIGSYMSVDQALIMKCIPSTDRIGTGIIFFCYYYYYNSKIAGQ